MATLAAGQTTLFECGFDTPESLRNQRAVELLPLDLYDKIVISISSGKDSVDCLLTLLDMGINPKKIELWHQCVDGRSSDENFVELMDWPITEAFSQVIGDHFGIPVRYQWRSGGIYGELMRRDSLTGGVYYIDNDGQTVYLPTTKGKKSTRLRWPAMQADLRVRWCSSVAKIDVAKRAMSNHPDFKGSLDNPLKVLFVTGERREESPNRAKYLAAELHSTSTRSRLVHHARLVIDHTERDVWDMFEKYRIRPHVAYLLGWSRTSCMSCIFQSADLWAMLREIAPDRFNRIAEKEKELGHTIDSRMDVVTKANMGTLDRMPKDPRVQQWINEALSRSFKKEDLIVDGPWELPAGAFHGSVGGAP